MGYWVLDVDDFMVTGAPAVEIVDTATAVTTFVKEPRNASQKGRPWTRIRFTADSEDLPTTHPHEVNVTTQWGWTAFPDAVVHATLLQGSRFFVRRSSPFGVAGSPDMGNELRLLSKLDPDVMVSLRDYVRARGMF
jgi:hypothetical protein